MRQWIAGALCLLAFGAQARVIDAFDSTDGWKVIQSDQVTGTLRNADGGVCLDYDFHGVSGYVGLQRDVALDYPDNYAFAFKVRGKGPTNDFQFKLVDASGDNVWWVTKPKFAFPSEWTQMRFKKRHISKAWGPSEEKELTHSAKLEFTLASGEGGKGSACFDALTFDALPPQNDAPLTGNLAQVGDAYVIDLATVRELGGAILQWAPEKQSGDYTVDLSNYGSAWHGGYRVRMSDGAEDFVAMPEEEGRYVRISPAPDFPGTLLRADIQPLAFSASKNAFIEAVAMRAKRGDYPRGFIGEQSYWTIVGVDGGREQGLIGEDGAIEVGKGRFSIEPVVIGPSGRATWADVQATQSLQDDYLPIPSVHWQHPDFKLHITAFGEGKPGDARLVARYRLTNTSREPADFTLQLRARPLQVNPPSQFLNTTGGVSPIGSIEVAANDMRVDDRIVRFSRAASQMEVSVFAAQGDPLIAPTSHSPPWARDPDDLASGAMHYEVHLSPGESFDVAWVSSLGGDGELDASNAEARQAAVALQWHDKLDRVKFKVPPQGEHIANTIRTALAHMAISRVGPRLQPGTRSYARAWIRDGAMIGEGLLRLGREDIAKEFLQWYAPYQFDSGKVPCCVDDRGADPVPENDSHGELIYLVAEMYRYTRDRALLEQMWPHVVGAVKYMDALRASERTEANRAKNQAFYGLMPASISHEGYSAKPMHSYWDDFWALRGYKDAVEIAQWLGKDADAKRFAASRDQFSGDLQASLRTAMAQQKIDFIPGSAELGDFDATSTTIALAPGAADAILPPGALEKTFERYWREFEQRRKGEREWKDYTPYELRTVGTFVRLGWRDRAQSALDFFFADQQPRAWNQWAEVVSRTPRKPFFLGDLPHAWVASDYVRSALDLFAYERPEDESIVIAAGIPADWLKGEGIAIEGLRTPGGPLSYSLREVGDKLVLEVGGGITLPKGGLVLPWNGKETRVTRVPARVEIAR
ncbi:coagulation factor 5/8 type domain-containing protein [Noviluteimonas gilva]|uniref:Coagulation factor 5/8 type domain-containing protein n=1 Tax=Noviluteimonas gilva TaxID=2682097 RepID=A0A7C9HML9_9GAMM|nr:coagulation factor 5/8 type domain-containing protein [Lysobacter gilvus]MUV14637.1 coagulation factor 5/8 type domain-containing protein [Lysobacter gilvus]